MTSTAGTTNGIKKRGKPSTKSSSSGATVGSKEPRDILALGRKLVEELQLEPGVDTLGRWMAHHLAELMVCAESAGDQVERAMAEKEVADTILRLWDHRSSITRFNPLADLTGLLAVLRTLSQKTPPWGYLLQNRTGNSGRRAYDLLRRLTICLSLLEFGDIEAARRGIAHANQTKAWQSEDELEIVETLSLWLQSRYLLGETPDRGPNGMADYGSEAAEPIDLKEVACQIVDEVEVALPELREALEGNRKQDG